MEIPVLFNYNNAYTSQIKPGMIHSRNTTLTWFFERILTQRLFSVFEYDLPEEWDKDYFLYVLWLYGFGAVINTDKYGVIFQQCTLSGYNVYYRPSKVLVSNPLLQTKFGVNAYNSKFSWIFAADNPAMAESFKKMFDQVTSGNPAVAVDKKLFNENGDPRWIQFDQNLKNNFIGKDILECMATIDNMFCTAIGLPNSNYEKRERLLVDEINANNSQTRALADVWMETIKHGMDVANDMFGLDLDIRYKQDMEAMRNDNTLNNRTV